MSVRWRSAPLRPLEFFFAQYRRVWRGTAVTSVVTPVVYLLALGVGLGVFVDRSADLPDGISYLEFVAPGLMAAHRDAARHVRVELAGALRDQVGSAVPRDARDAAPRTATSFSAIRRSSRPGSS